MELRYLRMTRPHPSWGRLTRCWASPETQSPWTALLRKPRVSFPWPWSGGQGCSGRSPRTPLPTPSRQTDTEAEKSKTFHCSGDRRSFPESNRMFCSGDDNFCAAIKKRDRFFCSNVQDGIKNQTDLKGLWPRCAKNFQWKAKWVLTMKPISSWCFIQSFFRVKLQLWK